MQLKANEHPFHAEVPTRLRPFIEILLDKAAQVPSGEVEHGSSEVHRLHSSNGVDCNRAAGHTVSDKECRLWEDFKEK